MNTESAANDLTQLSSREQLSALMDGALPPDQTRFLLRRLQHDAPLAECWERWRLTGEVMRGLAPAQRLPADFASRVGAALHGGAAAMPQAGSGRTPAWLRWGGGVAMAASLAVVALMARQSAVEAPAAAASIQLASSTAASEGPGAPAAPTPAPLDAGGATRALVAASAVAVTARPQRNRAGAPSHAATRTPPAVVRERVEDAQLAIAGDLPIPQPDIVTRPWPRSVLPQYASGGLAVGFGEHARGATTYNPFQPQVGIGTLSPTVVDAADGDASREQKAANVEAKP